MWLRLRQIALVAHKLGPVVQDMRDVFGLEVGYRDPGVKTFGLENAISPVGNQFIEFVSPIRENTAGGRYLDRRGGDGGYMVICQCDDHRPRKERVKQLGIRKVMESDGHEYSVMQLHPRAIPAAASWKSISRRAAKTSMAHGSGRARTSTRRFGPMSFAASQRLKFNRPTRRTSPSAGARSSKFQSSRTRQATRAYASKTPRFDSSRTSTGAVKVSAD